MSLINKIKQPIVGKSFFKQIGITIFHNVLDFSLYQKINIAPYKIDIIDFYSMFYNKKSINSKIKKAPFYQMKYDIKGH